MSSSSPCNTREVVGVPGHQTIEGAGFLCSTNANANKWNNLVGGNLMQRILPAKQTVLDVCPNKLV